MTLLLLLAVGSLGALGTAWALSRGGTATQLGALGGLVAIAALGILALASPTPNASGLDALGGTPGSLFNGALVPGAYLRVSMALFSVSSIIVAGIVWLLRGTAALRGVIPAALAAQAGAAVALAASTPELGLVAGGATGLASIPVLLAASRPRAGVSAREVRIAVGTAAVALGVAAGAAALSRLVLASPQASSEGSGVAAAAAFGVLALALAVAARVGVFPYHVRVSALADAVPEGALPLVLVWLPFPLVAAAVDLASGPFASLAVPIGSAQALLLTLLVLATVAAAVGAGLQDDLRHAVGYLAIADLGLVVLAFAALSEAAWAPARTWLLTVAVTKTALGAWASVVEDRFASRSVPDLRGWLRPSPVLGIALALIVLATYGLPGWAVLSARVDLVQAAAGAPWSTVLLIASLLTLPAYARWAWLGIGEPTSHVDRAAPDVLAARMAALPARRLTSRPPGRSRRRDVRLPVEHERHPAPDPISAPAAPATTAWSGDDPQGRPLVAPPVTPPTGHSPAVPTRSTPPRPGRLTVTVSGSPRRVPPAPTTSGQTDGQASAADGGQKGRGLILEDLRQTSAPEARPEQLSAFAVEAAMTAEQRSATTVNVPQPTAITEPEPSTTADGPVPGPAVSAAPASAPAPKARGSRRRRAAGRPVADTALASTGTGVVPGAAVASAAPDEAGAVAEDAAAAPADAVAPAEAGAIADDAANAPAAADLPGAADAPAAVADDRAAAPGVAPGGASGADALPGVRVSPRSRGASRTSKPSAMATPRHPEASMALPLNDESSADATATRSATVPVRARSAGGRTLSAPARAAGWIRGHRTDTLSGAVLALALLAAVVAFGAFDVSGASREVTPAGPVVTVTGN